MKNFFNKIWLYIKFAFVSLFYSMEAANKMILSQSDEDDGMGVHQIIHQNGVLNDMLEQKVTKEVEETRDKYYRILKEADLYDTSTISIIGYDSEGNPIFNETRLSKRSKSDFMKHSDVLTTETTKLRTIQDNKKFENSTNFEVSIPLGLYDYNTTLSITRDGITPRIYIEKFVKKMVVRCMENSQRALVDFYLPSEASQFGKIDAILISNLFSMFETKNLRSDLLDFLTIEWYSDKAWNSPDVCLFKYDDIKPVDISVFDGNFVITFDCNIVSDGEYIAEKYKTKELDEKYETMAPKSNAVDIFALERKYAKEEKNKINLDTKTFRLNEDSN